MNVHYRNIFNNHIGRLKLLVIINNNMKLLILRRRCANSKSSILKLIFPNLYSLTLFWGNALGGKVRRHFVNSSLQLALCIPKEILYIHD